MSVLALAHGVDITTEVKVPDAESLSYKIDSSLMYLALRNLIENAIQHSPSGSSVHCCAYLHEGALTIDVIDYGSGIPHGHWDKVVQRFYRGSNSATSGSGLGLAIVSMALENQCGTLKFLKTDDTFVARLSLSNNGS